MRRLNRGALPWRLFASALLLLLALGVQAAEQPGRAAIASAHPAATVAGQETLAMGGNAFDAAVAISAALAVAEPYSSGLGGGGFFLLREAGAQPAYRFLDARERAPLAAHVDLYRRDGEVQPQLSLNGPLAAAIPGLPAALVLLAKRFGQLPLRDSLAPAIRLARDGVGIDRGYREPADRRLAEGAGALSSSRPSARDTRKGWRSTMRYSARSRRVQMPPAARTPATSLSAISPA